MQRALDAALEHAAVYTMALKGSHFAAAHVSDRSHMHSLYTGYAMDERVPVGAGTVTNAAQALATAAPGVYQHCQSGGLHDRGADRPQRHSTGKSACTFSSALWTYILRSAGPYVCDKICLINSTCMRPAYPWLQCIADASINASPVSTAQEHASLLPAAQW